MISHTGTYGCTTFRHLMTVSCTTCSLYFLIVPHLNEALFALCNFKKISTRTSDAAFYLNWWWYSAVGLLSKRQISQISRVRTQNPFHDIGIIVMEMGGFVITIVTQSPHSLSVRSSSPASSVSSSLTGTIIQCKVAICPNYCLAPTHFFRFFLIPTDQTLANLITTVFQKVVLFLTFDVYIFTSF